MAVTDAYAAVTVCSPTRVACITGMSPGQIGLTTHIPGFQEESGLRQKEGRAMWER